MKKRKLKIILGILFTVFLCWGCRALLNFIDPLGFDEHPDVLLKKNEYYMFDPQTVLEDTIEGKPILLTLLPGEPETTSNSSPAVLWKQTDYLKVVDATFLSVWGESSEGWKLDEMSARADCAEVDLGFRRMYFTFVKVRKNEKTEEFFLVKRDIAILSGENLIWIYETETIPVTPLRLLDKGLDVDTIIPAEEAIRIAEENGGRSARARIDRCTISADLVKGANDDDWLVSYYSDHNFFWMEVDEKTGEIR
jgi:hypothetical protein